jgi:uncharacterized membrane protein YebE (DUF533 family)
LFKPSELLEQLLRCGIARSTSERLRHALGSGGLGLADRPFGAGLAEPTAGDGSGGLPSGLAETAQQFIGAERAGRGGDHPLPAGGALALFDGLAVAALRQQQALRPAPPDAKAPPAPPPAQSLAEPERLDQTATLILAAMINAAKADGRVDQEELQRIVGKLRAAGAEAEAVDFVLSELRKPMDLEALLRQVPDREVAVQLYAASLLAIEVDTAAERQYLRRLAHGLGLDASVVRRVHACLGTDHA